MIHVIRDYNEIQAQDVDRALGFKGTIQTVVYTIGASTFQGDIAHAELRLAQAREDGCYVNAWLRPSSSDIASGKVILGSPQMMADAKTAGLKLREHLQKGGKGGLVSILTECGNDWKCAPAKYIAVYEGVAAEVPVEFVRVFALTPLKPLSNPAAFCPPSAQMYAEHAYGLRSLDPNDIVGQRCRAHLELNRNTIMLPFLGFEEAGVIDVVDIQTTGKLPWNAYYKPLLGLLEEYKGIAIFMASVNWGFGTWEDGRWAPSLSMADGMAKYPNAPVKWWDWPGCPAACAAMADKMSVCAKLGATGTDLAGQIKTIIAT